MKYAFSFVRVVLFAAALCTVGLAQQFAPAAKYSFGTGFSGYSVALGDFNGDGVLDVAATTQSPDVKVWIALGNANGTLQPATSLVASNYAFVKGVAAGDFNKDGKLDLVVAFASSNGGGVNILLGNGDGTFEPPVEYSAGPYPTTVVVGDFDGDGNLDVAVTSPEGAYGDQKQNGGIAILLGNGDGTLKSYALYSAGPHPNSLALGDFNGDKVVDLAVGTTGNIVAVLLGNGDGTFQKPINNRVGISPHYVGVADFNDDGNADVLATLENSTTGHNKVVVSLGNGNGTLNSATPLSTPSEPLATAIADFNLDSLEDVSIGAAKASGLDGVFVLLGEGDNKFSAAGNYATGTSAPCALAVGDLNNDGYPDLVVLDNSSVVKVLLSTAMSQ